MKLIPRAWQFAWDGENLTLLYVVCAEDDSEERMERLGRWLKEYLKPGNSRLSSVEIDALAGIA